MKKALIIGPKYTGANALASTVNDIADWRATLVARGFTSISAKTGALTRSLVQSYYKTFVTGLKATDRATIILLGHGGRVLDTSGDEGDGYDEAFAASDLLPITDDWLRATLALSKSSLLDIVHDFCYAGTSTRIAALPNQPPAIDSCIFPQAGITFDPIKRQGGRRAVPVITNHRLWAACGEGELSYGVMSGGKARSIFSLGLCWWLRTYPTMNATDLMGSVAAYVTGYIPGQHPQLEGIDLNGVPF
jgi:hypothetical protein